MTSVGAYDAKTRLPELLRDVSRGEVVTITRHGAPIARLVPITGAGGGDGALVDAFRQARAGVRRGDLTIAEMVAEGRR